jgi:hypothetical protein
MHGRGARWEAIRALFDVECRRLGFNQDEDGGEETSANPARGFSRPGDQRSLFNDENP